MNGNSSEILYLLANRQGLQRPRFVHAPRQYFLQRIGELYEETRSRRPIRVALHANQATPEIPTFFSFELSRLEYVPST
jgi:hypothetical protein